MASVNLDFRLFAEDSVRSTPAHTFLSTFDLLELVFSPLFVQLQSMGLSHCMIRLRYFRHSKRGKLSCAEEIPKLSKKMHKGELLLAELNKDFYEPMDVVR